MDEGVLMIHKPPVFYWGFEKIETPLYANALINIIHQLKGKGRRGGEVTISSKKNPITELNEV